MQPIFITLNKCRRPQGIHKLLLIVFISTLLLFSAFLVYKTGGTTYVYSHIMYLPIIVSAFAFRIRGGVITAAIAGLLLGPYMPLDVQNDIAQNTFSWLYRIFFFIVIGVTTGGIADCLCFQLSSLSSFVAKLSNNYAKTLKTFAHTVSLRDEKTGGHCERVAYNAYMVGKEIGLEESELESLYWAGLLHDLGKIGVPEEILLKPGKLTGDEFRKMQNHPVFGYDLLTSLSPEYQDIALGVRAHHERWDGKGYPDGLAQESIPITGRILAVVDVFEALTSYRPYRDPMPPTTVIDYLIKGAGSYFDPSIVPVFKKLFYEAKIWVGEDNFYVIETEYLFGNNEDSIWALLLADSPFSAKTTKIILDLPQSHSNPSFGGKIDIADKPVSASSKSPSM